MTVTGDGTGVENGSGGLITNTTGVGISLTSTRASFTQLRISNTGGHGINVSSVTNFTYQDASIVNAADGNDEQAINLLNTFRHLFDRGRAARRHSGGRNPDSPRH